MLPSMVGIWLEADGEHRGLVATDDHEKGDHGAIGGREPQPARRCLGQERPRSTGTDQKTHDQPEVVAGDVEEVALAQVLPATQPGPAQATAIQDQGKAALAELGPELERLPGHPGPQPGTVVVDRPPCVVVTVPAVNACHLLLGDPALPGTVLQRLQAIAAVT